MISHSNVEYYTTPWSSHHDLFYFYRVPTYVESCDFYHTDSFIYLLLTFYVSY